MFEFKDFDYLTDGEIDLVIVQKDPAEAAKSYVPRYKYKICLHGSTEEIGYIDIRIGHNENTYYGGNIGYGVEEAYRGRGYAAKACRLIKQVGYAHGMDKLIITTNPDNHPSRATCEKIGARLLSIVVLPPYNEMYLDGDREKCIYEWTLQV